MVGEVKLIMQNMTVLKDEVIQITATLPSVHDGQDCTGDCQADLGDNK
jgi:hypothetical protein